MITGSAGEGAGDADSCIGSDLNVVRVAAGETHGCVGGRASHAVGCLHTLSADAIASVNKPCFATQTS